MNRTLRIALAPALVALLLPLLCSASTHPNLVMTKAGVETIRAELGTVPLFDHAVATARAEVDAEIAQGIDTPVPKDYSGGYTHERHKRNYLIAKQAGALFQILQDEKYAIYVRDMLFRYEAMYKSLPLHPKERSYARGKLFWQCLNDANWLVYMSQAYDAIYDWLSAEERKALEDNLFRPFADHISVDNPQFFNRVHNHSTWGAAAVGMIGLVMDDEDLVQRALYGIKDDGLAVGTKDDDGGFIKLPGQKAGYFANLAEPFSPTGYYTEGPYYQRYAMHPFLVFAQSLHNARPELEIFENEGKVLLKAVDALLSLSDADGEFFPLNDGQKGMSFHAGSVITAVDIAYLMGGRDPRLLGIAQQQAQVLLDDAGIAVATAVRDGEARPFNKRSLNLSDGPDGRQGGVAVLRYGDEALTLVFKYSAQGLSHGHYDKLSFSLYEQGEEILQDYGLARFVNIEQKGGGNYLPENTTWAKQTIAHNTITQNESSHFGGDYQTGSQHHSMLHFYADSNSDIQVVSAIETNAYPGTRLQRTMAMIKQDSFEKPFVLDLLKVNSESENLYDVPFHFMGQVLDTDFDYEAASSLQALGSKNGYQHLYVEAKGQSSAGFTQVSWMGANRFYTLSASTEPADELLFTRLGANDPNFNLRRDAAFMIRRANARNTVFASVIEPHGRYSPVTEIAVNAKSQITGLQVLHDDDHYTAVLLTGPDSMKQLFIIANQDSSPTSSHRLPVAQGVYRWTGPFLYTRVEPN